MVNAMINQPARPDPARPARRGVLARTLPRPQRQTPPQPPTGGWSAARVAGLPGVKQAKALAFQ